MTSKFELCLVLLKLLSFIWNTRKCSVSAPQAGQPIDDRAFSFSYTFLMASRRLFYIPQNFDNYPVIDYCDHIYSGWHLRKSMRILEKRRGSAMSRAIIYE